MWRASDPSKEPASDRQIGYIQSLVSDWDPANFEGRGGPTRAEFEGALEIVGVGEYDEAELRGLTKGDASRIIDALKNYEA